MRKAGIPEIDALVQKAKEDNLDRPDKISIEGGAKIKNYCMGVGISKGDFFYALADRLLVFDEKGRFQTRIHVSLDRSPLQTLEFITTGPDGSVYGLARSPNKGYVAFRMDR